MQAKPLDEHASPLNKEQARHFNQLVEMLSPEQASWISGYLAGLTARVEGTGAVQGEKIGPSRLTILYGSETGNAAAVAEQARARAAERGLEARVLDMADYPHRELKGETFLLIVTSTHGEGDPPDAAASFHEFLHSRKAPKLNNTQFAVLGLGDSSYEFFCQTAKDFDAQLEKLGATRLHTRIDCDIDYDEPAERWIEEALGAFAQQLESAPSNVVAFSPLATKTQAKRHDRKHPFPATVLENLTLNGRGSDKETRHIELSLEDSGLVYEPGDALGIVPQNDPQLVAELIETLGLDGAASVPGATGEMSLTQALSRDYEITTLTPRFIERYAEITGAQKLKALLQAEDRQALMAYMSGRQIIDVVGEFPAQGLDTSTFIETLRKLPPRLYSIASSLAANPDEAHLTVAAVRYTLFGRARKGVGSTYLADKVKPGDTVPVFVEPNKHFKLPKDSSAPIVMVGPGTGVAPFRAFLQEREIAGDKSKSWLFFGERRFRTDFLYQVEWQRFIKEGVLTRMDVAFSRDEQRKVYVQHRMLENSRELYAWLEEGAYVYVCGDATAMAPDVNEALLSIVEKEGSMTRERALEYLKALQSEKRYQRDIY